MAKIPNKVDLKKIRLQETDNLPREVDESAYAPTPPTAEPLRAVDEVWARDTLKRLSPEEKIGQLLMVSQLVDLEEEVAKYHVGGVVFVRNGLPSEHIVKTINSTQARASYPLWFALDSETGLGARVADATLLPMMMALGAVDDIELAEKAGYLTAVESQALGAQIIFGPVVDVNTDPENPVISTRSASDDPHRVARLAQAFCQGAQRGGALTALKHFPGHGAASSDTHHTMPVVNCSREELEKIHLYPYEVLLKNQAADLIMSAHIWFPAIDGETPWPATLSKNFNIVYLRERFGFQGVLFSDALKMKAISDTIPDPEEQALVGINSGLDVLVDTDGVGDYFNGLLKAVKKGLLSEDRINQSALRVLRIKSRSPLRENLPINPDKRLGVLNHPVHRQVAKEISNRSFTEVLYHLPDRPALKKTDRVLFLSLETDKSIFYRYTDQVLFQELKDKGLEIIYTNVSMEPSNNQVTEVLSRGKLFDKILVVGRDWSSIYWPRQVDLINNLCEDRTPVVYLSLGAPYHLGQIPTVSAFYCGYCSHPEVQRVSCEALTGSKASCGKLPVQL